MIEEIEVVKAEIIDLRAQIETLKETVATVEDALNAFLAHSTDHS